MAVAGTMRARAAMGAGAASKAAPALVEVLAAASLVTGAASLGTPRRNRARDGEFRYGWGIPRRSGARQSARDARWRFGLIRGEISPPISVE